MKLEQMFKLIARRKPGNFWIDPLIQKRLLLYAATALSLYLLIVGIVLGGFFYASNDILQQIPGLNDDILAEVNDLWQRAMMAIAAIAATGLVMLLFWTLIVSHRLAGAKFAIKRFVDGPLRQGHYSERLVLRKHDFLQDLADSLNALAAGLEKATHRSAEARETSKVPESA